ncbi:MAG: prolipoprotein diacylglyceryl transferase [Actinomycetota bacterium]
MHPELGTVGPLTINSFGVMIAIALITGTWFMGRDLDRRGLRPGFAVELAIAAAIGGVLGARLYYLVEHRGDAGGAALSGSGLVWYGGVIGGVAAAVAVTRLRGLPLGVVADAAAPALAIGYAIGRIGCQLAGDGTYGEPSDLPWAMSYPDGRVPTDVAVHPTPIYESLTMLVVFAVLWRLRGRLAGPWRLFGLYAVLAGGERLLVEFIRINDVAALGLTAPQLFSLAQIAIGAVLLGGPVAWRRRPSAAVS